MKKKNPSKQGASPSLKFFWSKQVFPHWHAKLGSLLVTIVLYLFYYNSTQNQVSFSVPVQTNLGSEIALQSQSVKTVDIIISGRDTAINELRSSDFEAYVLPDLSRLGTQTLAIHYHSKNDIHISPSTKIRLEPNSLTLELEAKIQATVPIELSITGYPASGFSLTGYSPVPKQVQILGPESKIKMISQLQTKSVDITGKNASYKVKTSLELPGNGVEILGSPEVTAEINIKSRVGTRTLSLRPRVIGLSSDLVLRNVLPSQVQITLQGNDAAIQNAQPEDFRLEVDAADLFSPGRYPLPVYIALIPEGLSLLNSSPERVTVVIENSN